MMIRGSIVIIKATLQKPFEDMFFRNMALIIPKLRPASFKKETRAALLISDFRVENVDENGNFRLISEFKTAYLAWVRWAEWKWTIKRSAMDLIYNHVEYEPSETMK